MTFEERLSQSRPLLLDGAMGTELLREGVDVSLPLWSAAAIETLPEAVFQIHRNYIEAGAEVITTNTFRTTTRTFQKITNDLERAIERARAATLKAVDLARKAATRDIFVAGSIAPLEDCYSPELFPGSSLAKREFAQLGEWLNQVGVDLLLIETMGRIDEAQSALEATAEIPCPKWVSFILRDEKHLLGGDRLMEAVRKVEDAGAGAVLVNCSNIEISVIAIKHILEITSLPVGLYPNLGRSIPMPDGAIKEKYSIDEFREQMKHAFSIGVTIIGSCCGSGPEHTRTLRELILSL